jgi:hypothetical protein
MVTANVYGCDAKIWKKLSPNAKSVYNSVRAFLCDYHFECPPVKGVVVWHDGDTDRLRHNMAVEVALFVMLREKKSK